MRQDVDRAHAHQRAQTDRRAAVVREHHEGPAVRDQAAVQGHAVHGGGHAELAHAVVQIAPGVVRRVHDLRVLDEGVVRASQVRRAADQFGDGGEHRLQRLARGLARGHRGLIGDQLLQLGVQRLEGAGGQVAGHGAGEVVAVVVVQQTGFPRLAGLAALLADLGPGGLDAFGQFKRLERPVQRLTGSGDLNGAQRRAVGLVAAFQGGGALADLGLAGDQRRLVLLGRPSQGLLDLLVVVAVDGLDRPARGLEAGQLVGRVRQRQLAVDGDLIVVPQDAQLVQLQAAGQRNRFLRHAFHQAAVAGDDPGAVVDQILAEARGQMPLRQGEADGVGQTLAQRAGG
uniref:Transcriptional regulator n=1 Tax=Parastrongyloides trichosuri TaxID=131310 RepID=A0A0N5A0Q4_PARTI